MAAYPAAWALTGRLSAPRPERFDRALGNDLVLVAQCAAMVPVLVAAGRGPDGWLPPLRETDPTAYLLAAVCALALLGSTLHVRSLIRERRRPGFAGASRVYAAACLLLAVGAAALGTWWPLQPAAVAVVRGRLVSDPGLRPGRIGMVELAVLACLAVAAWWA